MVIAKMPAAIEVKFGVSRNEENQAQRDTSDHKQRFWPRSRSR
jgi:hypothetical protein